MELELVNDIGEDRAGVVETMVVDDDGSRVGDSDDDVGDVVGSGVVGGGVPQTQVQTFSVDSGVVEVGEVNVDTVVVLVIRCGVKLEVGRLLEVVGSSEVELETDGSKVGVDVDDDGRGVVVEVSR